jgi:hypothetical protein
LWRNNDDQGKTDTTPVTSDKTSGSVGVHKLAPEAGMFFKAKVNGVNTNLQETYHLLSRLPLFHFVEV